MIITYSQAALIALLVLVVSTAVLELKSHPDDRNSKLRAMATVGFALGLITLAVTTFLALWFLAGRLP